ncbi:MAG: Glyoxalase/bleomycin resistance protein/dioxygenase [Nevskia sp.]|nr:Glyoxalase/bleomycin resistance protein/dioxygenase [Nevskia sp.]
MIDSSVTASRLSTYLCTSNAAAALDFYVAAFGATEVMRWIDPDNGKIGHAEIRIGETTLYLADEYPQTAAIGVRSAADLGGTTMQLWLQVGDVDAAVARAVAAGARQLSPIEYGQDGERRCRLADPGGHLWTVSTPLA